MVSDLVAERAQGPGLSTEEPAAAREQKLRLVVEMQVASKLTQKDERLIKGE